MKNIVSIIIALLFISQFTFAQGEKSLKMASKAFSEFSKDPFGSSAKLDEAKSFLEEAFKDEKVASNPKAWMTRADIFYNSGDQQTKARLLNPESPMNDPDAAINAFESYVKALELAQKKGDIKNAMKGLVNAENLLNNIGVELYKDQNYAGSYKNFKTELAARDFLKSKGEASRLDADGLYGEKLFFAGLTAYYAEDYQGAIDNLVGAKDNGHKDASIYQVVYESYRALEMSEKGLPFLEEGRKEFPDDTGLLFSEINHYLATGELDQMIGKLEYALEKEPDNQSLILTLGQVYDQLQVKANGAGEMDKGAEYFDKALGYYNQALANSPEDFDLNYSVGALYYNKAAGLTPALNEVANDFSKAGEQKYNEIKDKMAGLFDQALPYFLKADSINGEDRNTLIALKEIFARKDNFEKSNEYKDKLDTLLGQ